jgi:hypothetical protein
VRARIAYTLHDRPQKGYVHQASDDEEDDEISHFGSDDEEDDEISQFETAADVEHKLQELEDLYQVRAIASHV